MANPEHLEILKQGVETWNQWRKDNPNVQPDLRNADLNFANLGGAFLSMSDLSGSLLVMAYLFGAKLRDAELSGAFLCRADLRKADLTGANLYGASLDMALLITADLRNSNLVGANLYKADLERADLSGADIRRADFRVARIIKANLERANLTGVSLWGTQFMGWSIKSVICEYVFWDGARKDKSLYRPGEFERLFADKTKVRIFYKDSINPLEIATLPALIKHLEESHSGSGLRLVGIKEDSGGVVVELAIEDTGSQSPEQLKQLKATLETMAQQNAEHLRQVLNEREAKLQLQGEVKQLTSFVEKLLAQRSIIMGDTYNISGQAGAVGQNAHANDMTFNQMNHFEQTFDLPALATQLAELREEMAKRQARSPQAVIAQGEAAKAEMAAKEGNTSKMVEHLKTGGEWLLDIAKETGKELLTAAIKTSMGLQ